MSDDEQRYRQSVEAALAEVGVTIYDWLTDNNGGGIFPAWSAASSPADNLPIRHKVLKAMQIAEHLRPEGYWCPYDSVPDDEWLAQRFPLYKGETEIT